MLSDKYKKLAEEAKSPYLKEQYLKEARNAVVQENIRGKAMGRLRNPNIPTGADAMKMDVNAVENKRRYKRLQDLDGKLLEKLKKDSERHPIRKWTTTALGRKLGKACKIEGKKAKMENERGCLISEINETLPDEDKGDFKRLRELSDELMEEHIAQFKEVGEMMNMKVGKGRRMKGEMEVYERNIGIGKDENVGIFFKDLEKEEKCEAKLYNLKEEMESCKKNLVGEKFKLRKEITQRTRALDECTKELNSGKRKAKDYVIKTRNEKKKLKEEIRALKEEMKTREEKYRKKLGKLKRMEEEEQVVLKMKEKSVAKPSDFTNEDERMFSESMGGTRRKKRRKRKRTRRKKKRRTKRRKKRKRRRKTRKR